MSVAAQIGGTARALVASERSLFVGMGAAVAAFDTSDQIRPREVTRSALLADHVRDLAHSNGMLVAALGRGGIATLSASSDELRVTGTRRLPGEAEGVTIAGTRAYVATTEGLYIIRLAAASPSVIGTVLKGHRILHAVVTGVRMVVAAADEGLMIFDLTDPERPRRTGSLHTDGYAFRVASDGSIAYLADGWGGLRIVDVSDDRSPTLLDTVPSSGWANDVAVLGARVYVAAGAQGIQTVDVTDPRAPKPIVTFEGHNAVRIATMRDSVYVADTGLGLRVIAAHGGEDPREIGTLDIPAFVRSVSIDDGRAFIATDSGVHAIDISVPSEPRQLGALAMTDEAISTLPVEGRLFVGTQSENIVGLDQQDLLDGRVDAASVAGLGPSRGGAVSGSTLFYAMEDLVGVIDASTSQPCSFGLHTIAPSASHPEAAISIALADGLAVLGTHTGLALLDIKEPRDARIVARLPSGGGRGVAIGRGVIYVDRRGTLEVVQINGRNLRLLGSIETPVNDSFTFRTLAYGEGFVFLAAGRAGVIAVDVSTPRRPRIAGRLRLQGTSNSLAVHDGYLYVAAEEGGLFIIKLGAGNAASPPPADISHPGPTPLVEPSNPVSTPSIPPTPVFSNIQTAPCVVTNTEARGEGSLRACVDAARDGARITFDARIFRADAPGVIRLEAELNIPSDILIESERGAVIVDGQGVLDTGVRMRGDGTIIRGLAVRNMKGWCLAVHGDGNLLDGITASACDTGVSLEGVGNTVRGAEIFDTGYTGISIASDDALGLSAIGNRVISSVIGTDRRGRRSRSEQPVAVVIVGRGNTLGGPNPGDGNVLAGSLENEVLIHGPSNVVEGNLIRVNAAGNRPLLNPKATGPGILIEVGGRMNLIRDNVVADAITVSDPGSDYNSIVGNLVGVGRNGRPLVAQGAITIYQGHPCRVQDNTVFGYIRIANAPGSVVLGNTLLRRTGQGFPAGEISVEGSERVAVGGLAPDTGNQRKVIG